MYNIRFYGEIWKIIPKLSKTSDPHHEKSHLCHMRTTKAQIYTGERGGSVVECRTPEQEVGGSKPTAAVLCP